MIVVKLFGGLGNQMFQYANALNIANKLNKNLILDISWFSKSRRSPARNYELHNYLISGEMPDASLNKELLLYNNFLLRHIPFPRKLNRISEKHFHFDPSLNFLNANIYLNGYWQSYLYFNASRDILLKEFTPNKKLSINQKIQNKIELDSSSVAIHIRRSDFLTNPNHPVCNIEYYLKAANKILETIKNPTFYIFSDDPEYILKNIKFEQTTIYVIQGKDTYSSVEDLRLISLCSHQVIANSSFSWWGAWLNTNPDKIVITPLEWFANKKIDTTSLCPPEWKKI